MIILEEWAAGILTNRTVIDDKTTDQQTLRAAYLAAVNDLNTIIQASSMTNAEVVSAVQREAQIIQGILRYFAGEIKR